MRKYTRFYLHSNIVSISGVMLALLLCFSSPVSASSYCRFYDINLQRFSDTSIVVASQIPGLVAYYSFDGNTQDVSGMGYHGINNGASFISGVSGQALYFNGNDSYVSAPVNINPSVMPKMTMTAWVRAESDTPTRQIISHDNGNYDRSMGIDYRGGGTGWSCFSGSGSVLGYHKVIVGEWVFIAAVYDQTSSIVRLYLNDSIYEKSGTLGSGYDYINIGRNPSFGEYFAGEIDDLRIYNNALSSDEIDALRSNPGAIPDVTPQPTPAPTPATPSIIPVPTTIPPAILTPTPSSTPSSQAVQSATPIGDILFESRSKASGSLIQIPLLIKGAKEKISNLDATVTYDPAVLNATGVIKGGLTSNAIFDFKFSTSGIVQISLVDNVGFHGDGSVAYIMFNITGAAGATSPLKITNAIANRVNDMTSMNLFAQDGVFSVLGSEQLKGDYDGDGELSSLDALAALQMAVGKRSTELLMDVSGDGEVTSLDAREILKKSVSNISFISQTSSVVTLREMSDEQHQIVEMFGWPRSFSLLAVEDAAGTLHCSETWMYYDGQTAYIFLDGAFQTWHPVEPLPEGSLAVPYSPDGFALGSSIEDVQNALAPGDILSPVPDFALLFEEFGEGVEIYSAPQLVAVFIQGRLVYLEGVSLVPQGGG